MRVFSIHLVIIRFSAFFYPILEAAMSDLFSKKCLSRRGKIFHLNMCRMKSPQVSGTNYQEQKLRKETVPVSGPIMAAVAGWAWAAPPAAMISRRTRGQDEEKTAQSSIIPKTKETDFMSIVHASRKKRARYDGRVEYLAIQSVVGRMRDQGYTARAIFEEMSRQGRITIAYTTFCEYVRGGGRRPRKNISAPEPDSAKSESAKSTQH
jgi:hypothetical protein